MIIWINGAFGSGKTSVAKELHRIIEGSYVYDPEEVGQFLRKNMPECFQHPDFQDHPLWRSLNYEVLEYLDKEYKGSIIVPMTITNEEYYNSIVGKLKERNIDIKTFTLIARKENLLKRLKERGDGKNSWIAERIDYCVQALQKEIFNKHIDTNNRSVNDVATLIGDICQQ